MGIHIGKSKVDQKALHWKEISQRVTTHEGEFLSGSKGREYQQKYSKKYLGKDLSTPIDTSRPEYQQELRKQ